MRVSRISMALLLAVGVFISLFLFFLVISLNFFIHQKKTEQSPIPSKTYLYQEIDSSTSSSNDASFGFVTLPQTLSDDDFISYHSRNGNQIIISNFATSRFECQGSCFCSSEKRRSVSQSLPRPLFLVISAISVSLALKIAEKTFHNQCLLHFSSTCDEESIESSVSSCSEKDEEEPISNEEVEYAEYDCEGYCITSKNVRSRDGLAALKEFEEETGGCEKLKTFGTVRIERKINEKVKKKITLKGTGEVKEYPSRYHGIYLKAQYKFAAEYLTHFCKDMSLRYYWWHSPTNPKNRQRLNAFMCVGSGPTDFPDERLDYQYKNVKCVMTSESKRGESLKEYRKNLKKKNEE